MLVTTPNLTLRSLCALPRNFYFVQSTSCRSRAAYPKSLPACSMIINYIGKNISLKYELKTKPMSQNNR